MSAGTLEKATIRIVNGSDEGTRLECAFNPNAYTVDSSVNYGKRGTAGSDASVAQFVDGNAETLSMELFFDTSEADRAVDVRTEYTDYLDALLSVDDELNAPPVCRFVWGNGIDFTALLQRARKQFTRFQRDGVPVRARVDVVFQAYEPANAQRSERTVDRPSTRTVTEGETLWALAADQYDDPTEWRTIAAHNDIDDPRSVEGGRTIELP